jgi:hypothetical protein
MSVRDKDEQNDAKAFLLYLEHYPKDLKISFSKYICRAEKYFLVLRRIECYQT